MKLVKLPGKTLWVNPSHVVYVDDKPPYEKSEFAGRKRVEVCFTMYGQYRTENVYDMTAGQVAEIINGGSE